MSHPDEGLIHAWLDGELDAAEAARLEALVKDDPEWAAAAAEARGFIAATARIVGALDDVPANVVPQHRGEGTPGARSVGVSPRGAGRGDVAPVTGRRPVPWWTMRAAATLVVVVGTVIVLRRSPDLREPQSITVPIAAKDVPARQQPAPTPTAAGAEKDVARTPAVSGRQDSAGLPGTLDQAKKVARTPESAPARAPAGVRANEPANAPASAPANAPTGTPANTMANAQVAAVGKATDADAERKEKVTALQKPAAAKTSNEVGAGAAGAAGAAAPPAPAARPAPAAAGAGVTARRQATVGALSATAARPEASRIACFREAPGASGDSAIVHRVTITSDSTALPAASGDLRRDAAQFRAAEPLAQLAIRRDTLLLGAINGRARYAVRITCP